MHHTTQTLPRFLYDILKIRLKRWNCKMNYNANIQVERYCTYICEKESQAQKPANNW